MSDIRGGGTKRVRFCDNDVFEFLESVAVPAGTSRDLFGEDYDSRADEDAEEEWRIQCHREAAGAFKGWCKEEEDTTMEVGDVTSEGESEIHAEDAHDVAGSGPSATPKAGAIEELLSLDHSRLTVLFCGAVKRVTQHVQLFESQ